jgi:hypothetical protein
MDDEGVRIELVPSQPPPVVDAVAEALAADAMPPDPWWRAGLEENLDESPET